jgi:hypothetical protein
MALSKKEKEFVKSLDLDAIIYWCKNNNQLPWLEAKMEETVTREYYGYLKAPDPETGKMKCVLDEYGHRIIDRSKPPRRKTAPIGFMEIKRDFLAEFMPHLVPEKPKSEKLSMKDKVRAAMEAKEETA